MNVQYVHRPWPTAYSVSNSINDCLGNGWLFFKRERKTCWIC